MILHSFLREFAWKGSENQLCTQCLEDGVVST